MTDARDLARIAAPTVLQWVGCHLSLPTSQATHGSGVLVMVEGVERIYVQFELARSPKWKSLPKPMSQLLMPGWRRKLRDVLPYVPIAGLGKAAHVEA